MRDRNETHEPITKIEIKTSVTQGLVYSCCKTDVTRVALIIKILVFIRFQCCDNHNKQVSFFM